MKRKRWGARFVMAAVLMLAAHGCHDAYPPSAPDDTETARGGTEHVTALVAPRWCLIDLGDANTPVAMTAPRVDPDRYYGSYIEFNADGSMTGYAACNYVGAVYKADDSGAVRITNVAFTTHAQCGATREPIASALALQLGRAERFHIVGDTLVIASRAGNAFFSMKFLACKRGDPLRSYLDVALGDTLRLPLGGRALAEGVQLTFGIDSIVDSRCPKNVNCAWEGDAAVYFSLRADAKAQTLTLHTNPQSGLVAADVGAYRIALIALDPYPDADVNSGRIDPLEYVATLIVR